ncbi:restriction endonuclease subunit S [Mycolicibacterium sp. HK-90]|uniref:restriction endonuclease subunit S n=1 Tax=Mycolicibacterium sp. HK-90 TaxID=3056937 RepID=UPI0026591F50|nr:restriction endonuclease subunit S [Mycolicibacterium sp. HK-90]WKG01871.1 restriction endonuclease subunit S [Mycolicibacterium sp. HK-90]
MKWVALGELITSAGLKAGNDTAHTVYSVTKHSGFVPSTEYFKKQVFSRELDGYKRVRPGDFAYATIHLDEGSIGIAPSDGLISPMYTVFHPNTATVYPQYLLRFLKSPTALAQYPRFGKGSVHRRKSISLDALCQLRVPLPPINEQRRIAAILDTADLLRKKRREAQRMLYDASLSIFVNMFGDPVANTYDYDRLPFGELLMRIDSGTSPVCEARPAADGEWAVLKLGAVSYGTFNPAENKAFLGEVASLRQAEVHPGDFLFSRKNTKELVGATAIVHDTPPKRLLPDLVFRLSFDSSRVDSEYLHALLRHPRKRQQVVALASGSASSMANISQARLRTLDVELPPIERQREYASHVRAVRSIAKFGESDLKMIEELYNSLQSHAFRSEL